MALSLLLVCECTSNFLPVILTQSMPQNCQFTLVTYFVSGEWVAEWQVSGASKEDLQRFAKAQLEVYGRATFGWAYWTLKNVNNHWSLEWMIKNGYIKL